MRIIRGNKLNDKGLSLVELIIAVSIGVIVSGSIAALISFAIRMYRDESANLSAQYELQTNVNQIMDTIMGANTYVIQNAATTTISSTDIGGTLKAETHYAAFGSFASNKFTGVIFVAGPEKIDSEGNGRGIFEVYMDRGEWTGVTGSTASDIIKTAATNIAKAANHTPYLLGDDATTFRIEPKKKTPDDASNPYVNISSDSHMYFNPLSVEVELSFQKDATGKVVNKHVKDEAYIRNKVSMPIYINGTEYTLDKSN